MAYKRRRRTTKKYSRKYKKRRFSTKRRKTWKRSSTRRTMKKRMWKVGPRFDRSNLERCNFLNTPNGVGRRIRVQQKYHDNVVVASTAAASFVDYTFNLRGVFDPNTTSGGHQPRGFDQVVATGYDYYKVHGVTIEGRMGQTQTEDDYPPGLFTMAMCGQIYPWGTLNDVAELGATGDIKLLKKKYMFQNANNLNANLKESTMFFKKYIPNLWGWAKRFNRAYNGPQQTEIEQYDAYTPIGTIPDVNTTVNLVFTSWAGNGTITTQGFNLMVLITYDVEYVYGGDPAQS